MNIFVLDNNPIIAAEMACDKHVIKMILESAQLLCAAFEPGTAPYRRTHYNHPCSIWARESAANFNWLASHAYALNQEYVYRYSAKRYHLSVSIIDWCMANQNQITFTKQGLTPFVLAMPDDCKTIDAVQSYRNYYIKYKSGIALWAKKRSMPDWFAKRNLNEN